MSGFLRPSEWGCKVEKSSHATSEVFIPRLTPYLAIGVALAVTPLAAQQSLSHTERRVRQAVAKGVEDQIGYLQRIVDRPSSRPDLEGVRAVGAGFARSLDSLGFETRWADMPSEMRRAGHLIADHRGKEGKARLLLIGHLDTVVDPGARRSPAALRSPRASARPT